MVAGAQVHRGGNASAHAAGGEVVEVPFEGRVRFRRQSSEQPVSSHGIDEINIFRLVRRRPSVLEGQLEPVLQLQRSHRHPVSRVAR